MPNHPAWPFVVIAETGMGVRPIAARNASRSTDVVSGPKTPLACITVHFRRMSDLIGQHHCSLVLPEGRVWRSRRAKIKPTQSHQGFNFLKRGLIGTWDAIIVATATESGLTRIEMPSQTGAEVAVCGFRFGRRAPPGQERSVPTGVSDEVVLFEVTERFLRWSEAEPPGGWTAMTAR